ncbi:uncharacterized protein LOC113324482 [Papaver somniferum]|uniref:uncharacterized protein LOC113324482 n=1 Tax=Papaver somniferum TaxID=3469 RepID=UPI000E6F4BED|nr:uncharacterized protein LOC113324482 [Papaver somniferum]
MYDLKVTTDFGITGIPTHINCMKQCFFQLPTGNQILICCDGASKGNPGNVGVGFIDRNQQGDCMGASTGGLGVTSNYIAEIMDVIIAGEWAVKKRFTEVCFCLDSSAVLKSFINSNIPWIVRNRWNNLKKSICNITFKRSYREINFSVDKMAKNGVLLARGDHTLL